jgi:hypothetical protein
MFGDFTNGFEVKETAIENLERSVAFETENFVYNANTNEYYLVNTATNYIYAIDSNSTVTVSHQLPIGFVFSGSLIGYNTANNDFRVSGSYLGDNGSFTVDRTTFAITYVGLSSFPISNIKFALQSITQDSYIFTLDNGIFTITTPTGTVLENLLSNVVEILLVGTQVVVMTATAGDSSFYTFSFTEPLLQIGGNSIGLNAEGKAKSYAQLPAQIQSIKVVSSYEQLLLHDLKVNSLQNNYCGDDSFSFTPFLSVNQAQPVIEANLAELGLLINGETTYSLTIEPNTKIYIKFNTKRIQL